MSDQLLKGNNMSNKEIAEAFSLLADLMELHNEEDFKIKSYQFATRILKNVETPLAEMTLDQLKEIKGVGNAISNKILELTRNGKMKLLSEFILKTPEGIISLLKIKGLGVKKIQTIWKELEVESPGELLYACNENRLVALKGFSEKTQANIKEQLEYYFQSLEKYRWASVEILAEDTLADLENLFGVDKVLITGQFRRLMPVVNALEYIIEADDFKELADSSILCELTEKEKDIWEGKTSNEHVKVRLYRANKGLLGLGLIHSTGSPEFVKDILQKVNLSDLIGLNENEIFQKLGIDFIVPEIRDLTLIHKREIPELIKRSDVKGLIHLHTNYSDGAFSLKEMAEYAIEQGFDYMGVTDHSQSAFYANGLKADRVLAQWKEIDDLNAKFSDFKIFKGIESDIKYDGDLDYEDEILSGFDFVIASIHSSLKMDKNKATQRLLKAIENPFTTMLGHPTGRLLLSRPGYPIDHQTIIKACAHYNVIIEINANPLRLDLDYEWLPFALEHGVKISINPDAHSKKGVHDIKYGIQVARKGLLTANNCVNCLDRFEFEKILLSKKCH
jgi:DNA polymerase (family 10)